MNQQEDIQAIFLKWFKHHGVRSMSQIRQNVKNLCNSYNFEFNGLYWIFNPLVRKGFIEFIGEDQYQIAPSIIIHDRNSGISTGINLNDEQITYITDFSNVIEINPFGVISFESVTNHTQQICKEINSALGFSNIEKVLSNYPKLGDVILSFEKNITIDVCGHHYKLSQHEIDENSKTKSIGIFTTEKDSHRYYFFDGTECYELQSRKNNPEEWYIAETYQAIKEGFDFIVYKEQKQQLTIKNINIPILIDRLLRIPSLHLLDGVTTNYQETTYKNISVLVIRQLDRIFETKINTINE